MLGFKEYVTIQRWSSFWHQIAEVMDIDAETILIVGGAEGVIEPILRAHGKNIYVFDKREEIEPYYCGDLRDIEKIVNDRAFDIVMCCQVLEHIEFEYFERIVKHFSSIAKKKVIISLPYSNLTVSVWMQFVNRVFLHHFGIPRMWQNKISEYHKWEMGTKSVSKGKVRKILKKYFRVEKEYQAELNPYHVFFVLDTLL